MNKSRTRLFSATAFLRTGRGNTFWFELPLKKISAEPEPPMTVQATVAREVLPEVAAPCARRTKSRVLLAEDNEINQELAREMIQFAGCECECVVNGHEAVLAAASGMDEYLSKPLEPDAMNQKLQESIYFPLL